MTISCIYLSTWTRAKKRQFNLFVNLFIFNELINFALFGDSWRRILYFLKMVADLSDYIKARESAQDPAFLLRLMCRLLLGKKGEWVKRFLRWGKLLEINLLKIGFVSHSNVTMLDDDSFYIRFNRNWLSFDRAMAQWGFSVINPPIMASNKLWLFLSFGN